LRLKILKVKNNQPQLRIYWFLKKYTAKKGRRPYGNFTASLTHITKEMHLPANQFFM